MKAPTGADVASLAGVSREAVSQIINGHANRFRPETVSRVMTAIHELGYRPSAAGRALRLGSNSIALMLLREHTTDSSVLQTMRGLDSSIVADGQTLLACLAPGTTTELEQILTQVRPSVVISPTTFSDTEYAAIRAHGASAIEIVTASQVGLSAKWHPASP